MNHYGSQVAAQAMSGHVLITRYSGRLLELNPIGAREMST